MLGNCLSRTVHEAAVGLFRGAGKREGPAEMGAKSLKMPKRGRIGILFGGCSLVASMVFGVALPRRFLLALEIRVRREESEKFESQCGKTRSMV
jgi:hypothetical protein